MKGIIRTLILVLGGAAAATQAQAESYSAATPDAAAATAPAAGAACGAGGACGAGTGQGHCNLYDRCWPQRYSNLSQRAVNRAFAPQVMNGHVLEQTVWNHHFEPGTDRLTPGGVSVLQTLSRRRPEPDRTIYLATATDLAYDPACPERYCGARQELDALRAASIQKFLTAMNCGRCPDFQVLVHDPSDPSLHSRGVEIAVLQSYLRFRGGLANQAGGAGAGAGAAGGAAGGTGAGR